MHHFTRSHPCPRRAEVARAIEQHADLLPPLAAMSAQMLDCTLSRDFAVIRHESHLGPDYVVRLQLRLPCGACGDEKACLVVSETDPGGTVETLLTTSKLHRDHESDYRTELHVVKCWYCPGLVTQVQLLTPLQEAGFPMLGIWDHKYRAVALSASDVRDLDDIFHWFESLETD
jgi:hypothetical protein